MKKLFELFFVFCRIGLFTIGGGYAMIPQMKDIVVNKKKWLTEEEMLDIIAIAESTPGPISINMSTYVGYKQKGFLGSLISTLGVILPAFFIILIISLVYDQFIGNAYIQNAFIGIKCAVGLLILATGIEYFVKMKKTLLNIILFVITIAGIFLFEIFAINISSIVFIILGGTIGYIVFACSKNNEILTNPTDNSKEDK